MSWSPLDLWALLVSKPVLIRSVITFSPLLFLGNILSVIVLLNKEKICFNYLLTALNIFDTLHIVFAILDVIRNNHQSFYPDTLLTIFPYFHYPLYRFVILNKTLWFKQNFARLTLCCSIYMVVAVSVERFLAVTRPKVRLQTLSKYFLDTWNNFLPFVSRLISNPVKRSVLYYILPTLAIATLINVGKFFEVETVTYCMDFTACGCGYHQVHTYCKTLLSKV